MHSLVFMLLLMLMMMPLLLMSLTRKQPKITVIQS